MKRIYLSPPHISGFEEKYVAEAFKSNWIAPLGPMVDEFEKDMCEFVGAPYSTALSSGTAALHLALLLMGVRQGEEVFCSSLTFSASANAIRYVGATPVFIDSDRKTWNIDPNLLEEELAACQKQGRPPAAVISVDIYGQSADYDEIEKICHNYDVPLIEDAAEALGATYKGKRTGCFGKAAIFSFNGNKIITTSGGGLLVSSEEDLIRRARFLATQARDPAPHYQHSQIGYNYRMSNLLAAVGRGQLKSIEDRISARRRIFDVYKNALGGLPGISFMPEAPYGRSNRWLTCIQVDPEEYGTTREEMRLALESENIEARPVWKPMHLQPVFASCRKRRGEISEELFEKGLCLPSGSNMSDSDQGRIIDVIQRIKK